MKLIFFFQSNFQIILEDISKILQTKKNIEGKNYFLQFIKKIPKLEFHPFKAYILYFSYMNKVF